MREGDDKLMSLSVCVCGGGGGGGTSICASSDPGGGWGFVSPPPPPPRHKSALVASNYRPNIVGLLFSAEREMDLFSFLPRKILRA